MAGMHSLTETLAKKIEELEAEVAERQRAEKRVQQLNRVYAVLSDINQAIVRVREPQVLFDRACRIAVEQGGFRMAWIGRVDEATKKVAVVAYAGMTDHYLEKLDIVLSDESRGRGPTASALHSGQHLIVNDIAQDPRMSPWRDDALRLGYGASAAFPLQVNDKTVGVFNLYAGEPGFFDDAEVRLLDEMALDISFALEFAEKESHRKQAEERLLENEYRYRSLFENMLDGYAYCHMLFDEKKTPDFVYIEVNNAFGKLTGLRDVVGKRVSDVIPGIQESNPELFAIYGRVALTGRLEKFETYVEPLKIWFSVSVYSPETEFFVSIFENITERKQAEAALIESSAQFRTLFEASPDAIMLIDPNDSWPILDCNAAACRMNGYTRDELIGQSVDVLNLTPGGPAERAEYLEQIHQNRVMYIETFHRRKGGAVFPVEVSTSLIALSGREVVLGIDRDITERKKRERELEAIVSVSAALRAANTRAEMLPILLEQVMGLLKASAAAVALLDPTTEELVVELGQGEMAGLAGQRLPAGAGIGGRVIATSQPYVTDNAVVDPNFYQLNWMREDQVRAAVCVPLITRQRAFGVLWAGRAGSFASGEVRVLSAIGDMAGNAIQRTALHEQTERRAEQLAALHTIDTAISSSLDLHLTLKILLNQVVTQLGVDAAAVLLFKSHSQSLEYAAGHGFRSNGIEKSRLRLGEGYAGQAALERRLIGVPNLAEAEAIRRAALLAGEGFLAYYGVPLIAKGELEGVLEIFHRAPLNPDPEWLEFLEALAGQAAIAIDSAQLFDDLQRSNQQLTLAYDATIEGWSHALDLRDKETEGHTQRVTEMTLQLAQGMGAFSQEEIVHIRRGALLHDIGKMGVPDNILLKPGPLTDEEWVVMRKHPTYAYELLSPISYLRQALDIPYCHHEKWDGTGYPRGLKGEQIPLAARLFAVVDVWDALRSDRPYRAGWSEDRVRDHIRSLVGTHFDPKAVEAFISIL